MITDDRRMTAIQQASKTCKCGHRILLDKPYKKCSHCGAINYRSEKDEFMIKMAQKIGVKVKIRRFKNEYSDS